MSIQIMGRNYDENGHESVELKTITPVQAVQLEDSAVPSKLSIHTEQDYYAFVQAYNNKYAETFNQFIALTEEEVLWPHKYKVATYVYPGTVDVLTVRNRTYVYVEAISLNGKPGVKFAAKTHIGFALAAPAYLTPNSYPKVFPLLKHSSKSHETLEAAKTYLESERLRYQQTYFKDEQPPIFLKVAAKPCKAGYSVTAAMQGYKNDFTFQKEHGFVIK